MQVNTFEYVFRVILAVAMNMTPNFRAEMSGVVTGFILPEVLIEVILAIIAALLGGGGIPLLAGRFASFIVRLRSLAARARSIGVLANILEAFVDGIRALARIGQGLHDEIAAFARSGADNIARIRQRLNQYTVEIDPNTLGMNGGNIRIVRKVARRQVAYGSTDLSRMAQQYRRTNNVTGARNVAVFEYIDDAGQTRTIAMASERGVGHAERRIASALQEMGVPPERVTRIYSELAPCNVPGGYCDRMLRSNFPGADVSYSFEYGDAESRARGIVALRNAVQGLFPD